MFAIENKSQQWINGYNAVIDQFNEGTPAHCHHEDDFGRDEWESGAATARHLYHIA
jgi:hypothetical protein